MQNGTKVTGILIAKGAVVAILAILLATGVHSGPAAGPAPGESSSGARLAAPVRISLGVAASFALTPLMLSVGLLALRCRPAPGTTAEPATEHPTIVTPSTKAMGGNYA